jgi:2,3-diketo-5-methylthio-1-phosphopentane phosphatase
MTGSKVVVTDFDGTMTGRDFFRTALDILPASYGSFWEEYENGELSHFDALAAIFAGLRCSASAVNALLEEMTMDQGIPAAFTQLREHGWSVVIASAGCEWYIRRLLAPLGVAPVIHANPGIFIEGQGLVMQHPAGSPYFNSETGIDKAMLVRDLLPRGTVVYAGDGRPDLAPSLLVPPHHRFAKGWLADELERRGEPCIRFEHWDEIARSLTQ